MIPATLYLIVSFFFFFKLLIFIVCSLKDSQNFFIFFIKSLPLHTSSLFSMLLNKDLVGIEKPAGNCYFTFAVDNFSGLFLHPSIFSIIHLRLA